MKTIKRFLAVLLLAPLGGCAIAAVGAAAGATYAWINGELKSTLNAPLPQVVTATKAALTDLELVGIETRTDKLQGKITAQMADGARVVIQVKAIDFKVTEIRIRVGRIGDKAVSEQIYRHIERQLGK
jgi:ABC-type sugar transport system substrate-binding protein